MKYSSHVKDQIDLNRKRSPEYFVLKVGSTTYGFWRVNITPWGSNTGVISLWRYQLLEVPSVPRTVQAVIDALAVMDKCPNFAGLTPRQFLKQLLADV
jgi:hypothetical protein